MLPGRMDYQELRERFRWIVPDRYNIGVDICDKWADTEPDRLALIHIRQDGTDERYSFGEMKAASNRLANLLRSRGIVRGDRVALLMPQTPEVPLAHIAVTKLAGIVVPMADLFGVDAVHYRLTNSGARILITTCDQMHKVAEIRNRLPDLEHVFTIDGAVDGAEDLHAAMSGQPADLEPEITSPDDPALMVYTSGTTGPPKGALHGHRVLLGHMPGVQFGHDFFPQPGDRMWTPSDWAWAGALFNILYASLHFGVTLVAHRFQKFDADKAFELINTYEIRNAFIAPTGLKMMRAAAPAGSGRKLGLRTIFSGGESVGRELQDWSQAEFGLKINEVYGQTECNLTIGSCAAIGVWRSGSIGRAIPGHNVAIIDDDGNPLPVGETGHIASQKPDPVMFLEYWGRPDATRDKFVGDWLLTGDQGYEDADGYFYFVGRDDDVITSAGYRIGPGEIEDCLLGHPAVAVAAVIGKPDPVRTEIVKAFIVLNDGYEGTDDLKRDITEHVRTRLAAHEYPREISFEESLPMTTTGKIIRRELRDRN